MNTPFFSIIVPVYNTEKYVGRCIDSLINQTFSGIEIICVDDGSADNSPAILTSYNDERLIIIKQEHGGVSRARNRGLENARGAYVLFADSDDYVSVTMCQGLYKIIRDKDPDMVVFGGQCFYHESFRDDSGFWPKVFNSFNDVLTTRNITYSNDPIHALFREKGAYNVIWTKCVKREIIEKNNIRFAESLNVAEDRTFCFSLFPCANLIIFTADKFYFYQCNRPNSATSVFFTDNYRHERQNFQSMVEVYNFWNAMNLFPEHQKEFIGLFRSMLFRNIGSIENQQQREDESKRLFSFLIDNFNSYSYELLVELRSPVPHVSIFKKAIRVLRKDGIAGLVRKILSR
ncbi:MAG: glycosyltransferase [Treponema sp.]|jgi:glycosyltransferase involved in cell wall biosynthesis|nr:glycosyltransferase [Treponema sp.]